MVRIAVIGCCHGELDAMYNALRFRKETVDLMICCGDFEAVRNLADLETMACPPKYRHMNSFYKYYTGELVAPVLTIFIGGNHEASNHLQELPYGGFVAPNIYYLGNAGCVTFGGIRIAGLSGLEHRGNLYKGRFERVPYSGDTMRSVYHIKMCEAIRLFMLSEAAAVVVARGTSPPSQQPIDVMLSHEWPVGITKFGDEAGLLRWKRHFKQDIDRGELGSVVLRDMLFRLRPRYWFSAHMHCRFAAKVHHEAFMAPPPPLPTSSSSIVAPPPPKDPNEIDLDMDEMEKEEDEETEGAKKKKSRQGEEEGEEILLTPRPVHHGPLVTNFLALDKILPKRDFLEIVDISPPSGTESEPLELRHDREWLAVIKATHHLTPIEERPPGRDAHDYLRRGCDLEAARAFVASRFPDGPSLALTSASLRCDVQVQGVRARQPDRPRGHPQTDELYNKLELQHIGFTVPWVPAASTSSSSSSSSTAAASG